MARYVALLLAQLRLSFAVAAQYRIDFFVDGAVEILWTSTALAPLVVVFGHRTTVAGWTFGESLVVVGFFILLQAVLEGVMNPSFLTLVEHVRKGTLDYVLLLPADAQFLVATGRFHVWRSINVITSVAIFGVAFHALGTTPRASLVILSVLLFGAAVALLHALWTLAMCTAFFAVKTGNVTDVLGATLDAARWPSAVFRGATRLVLTFVIPLGLMTTVPASALLGRVDGWMVGAAVGEAVLFTVVARLAWRWSLARYTSASS